MKRILAVLSFVSILATSGQSFAVGYNVYSALIYVYDQDGNPLSGIPVSLFVKTWYGIDQEYNCLETGTTGSNGSAYLACWIPEMYSMGLEYMTANMTDQSYTIISSQNTFSATASAIYPVFDIGLDSDGNGVFDGWEMSLAQKFCPVLFAPLEDRGVLFGVVDGFTTLRPVPVEIMDRDGPSGQPDGILDYHDVEVELFQAETFIGIFDMEDIIFANGSSYSSKYPDQIYPESLIFAQPPGGLLNWFIIRPQYEWATTNVPEDNAVWYSVWEQKMSEHAGDTWYEDGTTYVAFDRNQGEVRINYLLHYPFNSSAGRHEGDLPTIRVTINSQNPSVADIVSVSYPIHGLGSVRTIKVTYDKIFAQGFAGQVFHEEGNDNPAFANKYFVIDETHPVSFGGGYLNKLGVWGYGSHAQYPCPGKWVRTVFDYIIGDITLNEFVVGLGSIDFETLQFDFNNYQNIKVVPPRDYVVNNLSEDPNYNWLIFGGFWGHSYSLPSAESTSWGDFLNFWLDLFDEALFFVDIDVPPTNIAPLSPYRGIKP